MNSQWIKSSRSAANGQCVEARFHRSQVQIRDSKDQAGPVLSFDPQAWREFVTAVADDRLGSVDR